MQHTTKAAAQTAGGCSALPCTTTRVTLLVTGEESEGRLALVEVEERAGVVHPLHVHSHEDELVYVLDGHVRFHLDGAWIERVTGQNMLLPKGREHTYAVSPPGASLLILIVPAGLEGYYRELSQPIEGPCVYQDAERVVVVAARYGIDITGPPPDGDAIAPVAPNQRVGKRLDAEV